MQPFKNPQKTLTPCECIGFTTLPSTDAAKLFVEIAAEIKMHLVGKYDLNSMSDWCSCIVQTEKPDVNSHLPSIDKPFRPCKRIIRHLRAKCQVVEIECKSIIQDSGRQNREHSNVYVLVGVFAHVCINIPIKAS